MAKRHLMSRLRGALFVAVLAVSGCVGQFARSPFVLRASPGYEVTTEPGPDRPYSWAWVTYWSPEETAQKDAALAAEYRRKPADTPPGGRVLLTVESGGWDTVRALEAIFLRDGQVVARRKPDILDLDANRIMLGGKIRSNVYLNLDQLPTAARPLVVEVAGHPDGPWRFEVRAAPRSSADR